MVAVETHCALEGSGCGPHWLHERSTRIIAKSGRHNDASSKEIRFEIMVSLKASEEFCGTGQNSLEEEYSPVLLSC